MSVDMPRALRMFVPGQAVHVYNRGNNKMPIFNEDCDRRTFLGLVKRAFDRAGVAAHNFTLMTNHFHLFATPAAEKALSWGMQEIGGRYTRYFNDKYKRCGTVWQGRFGGVQISDEMYALICARYIEQNPVRAKIVTDPGDYAWSSYRISAYGEPSDWLVPHSTYAALGKNDEERRAAYRVICAEPVPVEALTWLRKR